MKKNEAADALVKQIEMNELPIPQREYHFAPRDTDGKPLRRWRFDLAWPVQLLAVEIDGSMFTGGRHGGQPSAVRDIEKRQAAAVMGWRVIPMTPQQAISGDGVEMIGAALRPAKFPWPF